MIPPRLRIVAAGRGKSISLPPIVDAVMKLVAVTEKTERKVRLVYLGTASYDRDEPFITQTEGFRKVPNLDIIKLDVSEVVETLPIESQLRETILSANILLVSGGNTLYTMNRWKELNIHSMIQEAVLTKNTVLCGGSAGAISWFTHGHSDSLDPTTLLNVDPNLSEREKKDWEYIRVEGLGYIPALCVPHHDAIQSNGVPRSQDSENMLLKYPQEPLVGIEDAAAIVLSDGVVRVVSGDGRAACIIKRVSGWNTISSTRMTSNDAAVPLQDFLQGRKEADGIIECGNN